MKAKKVILSLCACLLCSCGGTATSSSDPASSSEPSKESSVDVSSLPSSETPSSEAPSSEPAPGPYSEPAPEPSSEPAPGPYSEPEPEPSSEPDLSSEPSSEISSKEPEVFDGIKVYCDPTWTHIYAWVDKTELCGSWPGTGLKTAGDWKYYEFPDLDFINLIFNRGNGGEQTTDMSLNKKGVYYYHNGKWSTDEPGQGTSSAQSIDTSLPPVSADNYRTFYQLLVYSFADGNGDGIGDFKGIIDHLDYLSDLGIGALWLSPVQPADSYHSYDCTDYYAIRSSYEVTVDGVKYDFAKLLSACHAKGIKVVMDMVLNHTSSNHVWYSEHRDWYGSDDRFGFPEFDFDKTVVREAIKDVGKYWLNKGVDGFRLDAAYWVYNSGYDRDAKNFAWWQEFSSAMKETNPDCYLVGEVLDYDHDLAFDYTACGFDSTFDFETTKQTYQAFNGSASSFAGAVRSDQDKIRAINENAIMARALSNHDIGRFSQQHPDSSDAAYYIENEKQYKAATALNALTPGDAYIYYGDELGLKGTCSDTREGWYYDMNFRTPMPWGDSTRTNSTAYFENFHGQGITTSTTLSGNSIEEDIADPYSTYNVLKKALAIKNGSEVLQKGLVSPSAMSKANLVDYAVTYNGKTVHFYCNTSATSSLSIDVTGTLKDTITVAAGEVTLSGGKLNLPACAIAFVEE
ncbi:MAG: starch-binding protein [Bacilli bacterium]|nr:starch-binding protein [Bacilli bacterium]